MNFGQAMNSPYNRRFSKNNFRSLIFFITILCVVGVFVGHNNYNNAKQLDAHFATVSGTVNDKNTESAGRGGINYEVTYDFTDKNENYTKIENMNASFYNSVDINSPVTVVFDSENPSKNYIQGTQPTLSSSKLVMILSAVGLVVAIIVLVGTFVL